MNLTKISLINIVDMFLVIAANIGIAAMAWTIPSLSEKYLKTICLLMAIVILGAYLMVKNDYFII